MHGKPPIKTELYSGNCFTSMCENCYRSIGAGSTRKKQRCSRCRVACYCSADCQKQEWPAHRAECKAEVRRKQRLEQLTLSNPHQAALEVALRHYAAEIIGELIHIPMRTTLRLGHPDQRAHSHFLRLFFDVDSGGETLRERFAYSRRFQVLSFEEEEERIKALGKESNVNLPTREQREERKPSTSATSATGCIDLVARGVRLGLETNLTLSGIEVDFASIPFLTLSEWPLNTRWNECFQQAIEVRTSPDRFTAPMLDLLFSVGDEVAMRILQHYLGDDPFWADTLYTRKHGRDPPRREERLDKYFELADAAKAANRPLDMRDLWLAARRAVPWV